MTSSSLIHCFIISSAILFTLSPSLTQAEVDAVHNSGMSDADKQRYTNDLDNWYDSEVKKIVHNEVKKVEDVTTNVKIKVAKLGK
ncbi:hypothetical protein [Acinetobacter baumannii]|uniref:hypothetical protein n=1 Tax=Acinetobacter baumannii TaxID=470 RepID=UPI0011781535|nr:hypothetical protein [Acinetobacter baumannii]